MFEYSGVELLTQAQQSGDPFAQKTYNQYRSIPNRMEIRAMIADPSGSSDSVRLLSGINLEVVEGRGVRFGRFVSRALDPKNPIFEGTVVTADGRQPAPDGKVIVTLTSVDPRGGTTTTEKTTTLSVGTFRLALKNTPWKTARAYYLPPPGVADATSDTLTSP